ncbi:amino acid transporter AVT1J-like [Impatiens glandulifera]|uniref:amino acid transporter AVT1J-like n=1 Tax=Impatiens glandulifera TaxID=253017 RepID=UPI001FB04C6D|nr:amino acid transporter AVT1J-like [Impatiens glandulifera]
MEAPARGDEESSYIIPLLHNIDIKQQSIYRSNDSQTDEEEEGNTSFFKTCFNGLNALSGVGILSVPYALASGGWLTLGLLFIVASSTFYTALLIKRCMDIDPSIRTYPDIGELAFGKKGRWVVSIFMNIELYLVATGFLILEGDNLHKLLPNVGSSQMFIIAVSVIILPTVWLNMSIMSYISAGGVIASAVILFSVIWVGAFDGIGFRNNGVLLNWNGISTSLSLYAFCYCAHPVFPTLYSSMRDKNQFSKVLLVCFSLCTICYASMAVFGYLMFGSGVESQITLNLPTDKISSMVAIYTTLVNPISKYALMVTPIMNAMERRVQDLYGKKVSRVMIRSGLVISTVGVALLVPSFGDLMTLVGAFLSSSASIVLPCLCYLKISGGYGRRRIRTGVGFETVIIVGIVIMGICIAFVGSYVAIQQLLFHM